MEEKELNKDIKINEQTSIEETEEPAVLYARRRHRKEEDDRGPNFALRQILNIIFMLVAIAGCIVFHVVNNLMGGILIIIAMAFKMAECVIRYRNK